jgi:hypothetical protein
VYGSIRNEKSEKRRAKLVEGFRLTSSLVLGNNTFMNDKMTVTPERVKYVIAGRLMKEWFPTRIPVDADEWLKIATQDASWVVDELMAHGLLKVEGAK